MEPWIKDRLWAEAPSLNGQTSTWVLSDLKSNKHSFQWVCSLCRSGESQTPGADSTLRTPLCPFLGTCMGIGSPETHGLCSQPSASFSSPAAHRSAVSKNRRRVGGLLVVLCRFWGPHAFSPGCALAGVSGCRVLLAMGHLPVENRHEEPRPVSVLRANRALIFYVLRLKITSRSGGTWALTRRESPTSLCPRLTLVMRI